MKLYPQEGWWSAIRLMCTIVHHCTQFQTSNVLSVNHDYVTIICTWLLGARNLATRIRLWSRSRLWNFRLICLCTYLQNKGILNGIIGMSDNDRISLVMVVYAELLSHRIQKSIFTETLTSEFRVDVFSYPASILPFAISNYISSALLIKTHEFQAWAAIYIITQIHEI